MMQLHFQWVFLMHFSRDYTIRQLCSSHISYNLQLQTCIQLDTDVFRITLKTDSCVNTLANRCSDRVTLRNKMHVSLINAQLCIFKIMFHTFLSHWSHFQVIRSNNVSLQVIPQSYDLHLSWMLFNMFSYYICYYVAAHIDVKLKYFHYVTSCYVSTMHVCMQIKWAR